MFQAVDVGIQPLERYRATAGAEAVERIRALAEPLKSARVLHLNATPYGGGVAEILRSEVPLLRDVGLSVEWRIINGDQAFFSVTKAIHNGLQGASAGVTPLQWETYLAQSMVNARQLEHDYDLVVIHDPQPLAIPSLAGKGHARWVWRCHIDTYAPNPDVWQRLRPYVEPYDAAVFTLKDFVPPDFPVTRVEIIPPAIDPESPKNLILDPTLADRVLRWTGVDPDRPLVTQVSRFDPWKDPLGVISAYRIVRDEVPDCQLALVGSMALDDPEAWAVYRQILDAVGGDRDIHVLTNLLGIGNIEVNSFQSLSDVGVQKSIREGFGLVVSETLWKGTPVVAGRAGGIPLQLEEGVSGYLIDSIEECAHRILDLLRDPVTARAMGQRGREWVRRRFLLTRLLADELSLYAALLAPAGTTVAV